MLDSFFWRKFLARSGLGKYLPSVQRTLAGGEQYWHYYADRTLATPLSLLLDEALFPEAHTPDSIDLALGVPRCDLHLSMPRTIPERRTCAAWGDLELRQEIAQRFAQTHQTSVDPVEEVAITHGATGACAAVLDAFINPGERAVLFDPTSPIFPLGLQHRRANIAWVSSWVECGHIRFHLPELARAMRGAKLLLLAEPANPTGATFATEDLEQIAFWAAKYDVLLIQDVSYDTWRVDEEPGRLARLPHAEKRLLSIGSFAKSHGLTSARVGWLVGNRHLVRPTAVASLLSAPFVPPLCQAVALAALQTGDKLLATLREDYQARRSYVRERLLEMNLRPCEASGGFFCWVPLNTTKPARQFAQELLTETGVLVNPGEPFGPSGSKYIRLSFATDLGRLREGLTRMKEYLQSEVFAEV